MKAKITFFIGVAVMALCTVQFAMDRTPARIVGIVLGAFFVAWGLWIGWDRFPRVNALLGHVAMTVGCLVLAYGIYEVPFLTDRPSLLAVLDRPIFWGLFTICGGYCMITHGYCACVRKK